MSTTIQSAYTGFSISDLNQVKAYTEGGGDIAFDPISLTTGNNYSSVYTLSLTIVSTNAANVQILQSSTSGPQLQRSGSTYTLTSNYNNSMGAIINNWAYFKLALQGLSLHFLNSDWGETFNIAITFSDGTTTQANTIQIITTAIPDASGINPVVSGLPKAFNIRTLADMGQSSIQIIDPASALKTYRLTFTVNDTVNLSGSSNGFIWLYDTANSITQQKQKTCTISGTASYLNSVLSNSLTPSFNKGVGFGNFSGNFYGQWTVAYKQEVLTTSELGAVVPYVQETGTLFFNQLNSSVFTPHSNFNYAEDTTTTFSLGTLIDQAGQQWPADTSGLNNYTITASIQQAFPVTNPAYLTYSGDSLVDNTITFNGTFSSINSAAAVQSVVLIPPADYTGNITINISITRGDGFGNTGVVYNGSIDISCNSIHNEFTVAGGFQYNIGTNALNVGSITDLAIGKNYTVTLDMDLPSSTHGSLADTTGLGVWNPVGGVSGNGRLTITGIKSAINGSLAALTYTTGSSTSLSDVLSILYTQTQNTNSLAQGSTSFTLANNYVWGSGNVGTGFVFDEDTKITYNLGNILTPISGTAKARITLSMPFSTANGGSITAWTKISDTVWEFSGTKAAVNSALASVEFIPPADYITAFNVDMQIYDNSSLKYDSVTYSTTQTFNIRNIHNEFSIISAIAEQAGGDTLVISLGSITDLRPDNISSAITYSVVLTPSDISEITTISSSGSGGSSVWATNKLTITGTKAQVNSHLSTISIIYTATTSTTISYTQTQTTNSISQGTQTINVSIPDPQFMFFTYNKTARSSDLTNWTVNTLTTAPLPINCIQYPTYRKSRWTAAFPYLQPGTGGVNGVTIYKSTTNSWVEDSSIRTTNMTQTITPQNLRGVASGPSGRAYLYAGLTPSNVGYVDIVFTTDDINYTSQTFNVRGNYAYAINNCSIGYANGRYYVFFISTDAYTTSIKYINEAHSYDGEVWSLGSTFASNSTGFSYLSPRVDYANSEYFLFVNKGTQKIAYTSTDGTSWSSTVAISSGATTNGNCVIGPYGYPAFVSNISGTANITYRVPSATPYWSSTDMGLSTSGGAPYSNLYPDTPNLAVDPTSSRLMARVGTKIFISTNLTTWTAVSMGFTPYAIFDIKFYNGYFYVLTATSAGNCVLMKSTNGSIWTLVYTFPTGSNWTTFSISN